MKPIAEMECIQIEITNACCYKCSNCTRSCPHIKEPYFMTIEEIAKAIDSLEGYPGQIGMMGGEPMLHPQFEEICKLYKKMIPVKAKRQLWTTGVYWGKYGELVKETFYDELVSYNDHSKPDEVWHQPLWIAIDEVIENSDLMWKIIDNCWVQNRWSASITPKGAFFCEVACGKAHTLNLDIGMPVEKGWWRKPLVQRPQKTTFCQMCSGCLPMPTRVNSYEKFDYVSPRNLERLKEAGSKTSLKLFDIEKLREYYKGHTFTPNTEYKERGGFEDFPNWTPWRYRKTRWHSPRTSDKRFNQSA